MRNIEVELIANTPLRNAIIGARTCWKSFNRDDYVDESNIGENNINLLNKLVFQYQHESVIEHVVYTFRLSKFSRLILQELSRHRIASPSVESTRYVIKKDILEYADIFEQKDLPSFKERVKVVERFLTIPYVKSYNILDLDLQFETLKYIYLKVKAGVRNDEIKYILPENWRVNNEILTINARSLRNLLTLRTSQSAHFEFRYLAMLMLRALPKNHINALYKDILLNVTNMLHIGMQTFFELDKVELLSFILKDRFDYKEFLIDE